MTRILLALSVAATLILGLTPPASSQEVRRPAPIMAAAGPHDIVWANLSNATVDTGNTLLTSAGSWNNGGSSSESLASGVAGYVELTPVGDENPGPSRPRMFGLGPTNVGENYARINFAAYLEPTSGVGGDIHYSSAGSISGVVGTYGTGDTIRIEKTSAGVVTLVRNGIVIHTFSTSASTELYANVTAFSSAVRVENIILSEDFH